MNIAVFGGAFDPPHIGHSAIANYLIDSKKADRVWFLPVKIHAFGKKVLQEEHRLAMLEAVIANNEDIFQIQTYELAQTTTNITYHTLQHFRHSFLDDTFSFVIGADNLARFHEWDFYQELCREFVFWVYPRTGANFDLLRPGMIALTRAPEVSVSSTQIRQKIQQGETIDGLVEPAVAQYIKAHHLYT